MVAVNKAKFSPYEKEKKRGKISRKIKGSVGLDF